MKVVSITAFSFARKNVHIPLNTSLIQSNRAPNITLTVQHNPSSYLLKSSSLPYTGTTANMSTSSINSNNREDVRKSKQRLRQKIRSQISALSTEEIVSQSQSVWDKLYKLPQYQAASRVGLFLSMPKNEIRTDDPCRKVLNDGKTLFVPRVGLDFEQCDMDMIQVEQQPKNESSSSTDGDDDIFYKDWPKNKWGIPEAPRDFNFDLAQPGSIDLLVVPGLGFDRNGGRLGQGKGYYDRFITKMSSDENCKSPLLVAVGLEPSFVEEGIPTNEYDCTMDMVILPHLGIIDVKN